MIPVPPDILKLVLLLTTMIPGPWLSEIGPSALDDRPNEVGVTLTDGHGTNVVYVDTDNRPDWPVSDRDVLAHEIFHAVDFSCNDDTDRAWFYAAMPEGYRHHRQAEVYANAGQQWITRSTAAGQYTLPIGLQREAGATMLDCINPFESSRAQLMYPVLLGRSPDHWGLSYWKAETLIGNTSIDNAARWFTTTAEYHNSIGTFSEPRFVRNMFTHTLGRQPSVVELSWWSLYSTAHGRATAFLSLTYSPECVCN